MAVWVLSSTWARFLRQQQLYIAIAVAIYAIFWAIEPERANAIFTLVYTVCLCNLTVLMQNGLGFLYADKKGPFYWLVYLALLFALTPFMVVVATSIVFWIDTAPVSLGTYFENSWKFPVVATLIFGIISQIYHRTKHRLERRNRELQQAVEVEIAQRELQEQELERAREIQQSLLPKEIPQILGFEITGAWEPARVVGGDYFDVMKLSDSKVAICIADVVGKSVSAALLMANVQASVRAFASESASPSWLCSRVNAVLCNNIASGKFVTLFYGVLDAERRRLEYTNAGHLPPILISASGAVTHLENDGALLGVFPEWKYEDSSVQLTAGDRLLLHTDGITEAAKADGEEFGEDRLISAMKSMFSGNTAVLQAHLLSEVRRFCDSQLQDDATLIVIAAQSSEATSLAEGTRHFAPL
jgi:sigma-B regulation protein RsbU (phosphoserine phosphatase)